MAVDEDGGQGPLLDALPGALVGDVRAVDVLLGGGQFVVVVAGDERDLDDLASGPELVEQVPEER